MGMADIPLMYTETKNQIIRKYYIESKSTVFPLVIDDFGLGIEYRPQLDYKATKRHGKLYFKHLCPTRANSRRLCFWRYVIFDMHVDADLAIMVE